MLKIVYTLLFVVAFTLIIPSINAEAATKKYTISKDSKAPDKYTKLATYRNRMSQTFIITRRSIWIMLCL